jgi:5-methylcytosine-specific restriction protein A
MAIEENEMDFHTPLQEIFFSGEKRGLSKIAVNAGDLHRQVGGYPGHNHRMPMCCAAMRSAMRNGDKIIQSPPKGDGASFTIEYQLPR